MTAESVDREVLVANIGNFNHDTGRVGLKNIQTWTRMGFKVLCGEYVGIFGLVINCLVNCGTYCKILVYCH